MRDSAFLERQSFMTDMKDKVENGKKDNPIFYINWIKIYTIWKYCSIQFSYNKFFFFFRKTFPLFQNFLSKKCWQFVYFICKTPNLKTLLCWGFSVWKHRLFLDEWESHVSLEWSTWFLGLKTLVWHSTYFLTGKKLFFFW